ncbi:phosphatidate cytidylyltransferase [Spirochaetia bacterium]|nr:phosphatidate cytidylyltransferase [Spirochaetia bacterium]
MKKLIQRLLIFFIGVPLIIALVILFPQKNHLALNGLIIILSALGAVEFAEILKKRGPSIAPVEAALLGSLSPIAMTLMVSFKVNGQIIPGLFIVGASWLLVSRVFSREAEFPGIINYMAAGFSVMIYPGLFVAWLIRMALFPHSDLVILIFLLTVFANDSLAWAAGMLFGRGNQGIFKASPHKSIAGYTGGCIASVLVCVWAVYMVPQVFNTELLPKAAAGIILGLISAAAADLGDLAESALKRSADIKDSGVLIPGRGGILDSLDSIALTAPVFYVFYRLFFY